MSVVPLEKALVDRTMKRLRLEPGVWAIKVHGSPMGRRGVPDIIGCKDGRMFGLEFKRPGSMSNVTRLQMIELQKIADAGGIAAVVDSVDGAWHALGLAYEH